MNRAGPSRPGSIQTRSSSLILLLVPSPSLLKIQAGSSRFKVIQGKNFIPPMTTPPETHPKPETAPLENSPPEAKTEFLNTGPPRNGKIAKLPKELRDLLK